MLNVFVPNGDNHLPTKGRCLIELIGLGADVIGDHRPNNALRVIHGKIGELAFLIFLPGEKECQGDLLANVFGRCLEMDPLIELKGNKRLKIDD